MTASPSALPRPPTHDRGKRCCWTLRASIRPAGRWPGSRPGGSMRCPVPAVAAATRRRRPWRPCSRPGREARCPGSTPCWPMYRAPTQFRTPFAATSWCPHAFVFRSAHPALPIHRSRKVLPRCSAALPGRAVSPEKLIITWQRLCYRPFTMMRVSRYRVCRRGALLTGVLDEAVWLGRMRWISHRLRRSHESRCASSVRAATGLAPGRVLQGAGQEN